MQLLKSPGAQQEVTTVSPVDTTDKSVVIRRGKNGFLQNLKILSEDCFHFLLFRIIIIMIDKAVLIVLGV